MTDLEAILADLPRVLDGARWSYELGLTKAGRGLDADRGASLTRTEREQDTEASPYDLGGPGDHRARAAYVAGVIAIGTADELLGACLRAAGARVVDPRFSIGRYSTPWQVEVATKRAVRRANALRPFEDQHRRRIRHVRLQLDMAVRGFDPVLNAGSADGIAHNEDTAPHRGVKPEDRCTQCDLRKKRRKNGRGLCSTCERYRQRHGKDRPRHLDGISPLEAQRKRLARGESYGVA